MFRIRFFHTICSDFHLGHRRPMKKRMSGGPHKHRERAAHAFKGKITMLDVYLNRI